MRRGPGQNVCWRIAAGLAAALAVFGAERADGALLASYDFDPADSLESSVAPVNASASTLLRGPHVVQEGSFEASGFSTHSGTRSRFLRTSRIFESEAQAIDAGTYVEFTVAPDPGFTLDLTSLTFAHARGGSSAPHTVWNSVRSSVDGYATQLGEFSTVLDGVGGNTGAGWTVQTVDLSGIDFQGLTGPTSFRVYFWDVGGENNGGWVNRFDTLQLNGSVVPEPAAAAALVLAGVPLLRRGR